MALFSRKNLKPQNPFGLTEEDLKGEIKGFPMGVVVRMLEEQERQGNKPDVKVFQIDVSINSFRGGFDWERSEEGLDFWSSVIVKHNFNLFFKRYPDYARYNLT